MRSLVAAIAISFGLAAPSRAAEAKPWYDLYDEALKLMDESRHAEAVELLKQCLVLKPQEEARARTQAVRYIDYLPYLYLGIASAELGNADVAREYLDLSSRQGAVKHSEEGLALLNQYRLRLANAAVLKPPQPMPAGGLSEEEFQKIETQVMDRCRLTRGASPRTYPWYFHYELGLELLKHDDPGRALTSLLDALEKRERPQRLTRTYGMWYLNYAPYYNIGLAHYQLGNYDCAADALKMSDSFQEISPAEATFREREKLKREVEKKVGKR
jgi:tetratricopeptide (TPR) repeat protein